jgi:hypothetical protein
VCTHLVSKRIARREVPRFWSESRILHIREREMQFPGPASEHRRASKIQVLERIEKRSGGRALLPFPPTRGMHTGGDPLVVAPQIVE